MSDELLIEGTHLLTCDEAGTEVVGDLAVRGRRIVGVGPGARGAVSPGARVIDGRGAVTMPGFVQAHVHLVQALFRGMADDVPLLEWLRRFIWPLEAAHDEASLRASAELGLAEMLLAGTTTILDMGTTHGHDVVFEAIAASGMRAVSGKAMMDVGDGVPERLRESTRASLDESERLARTWTGHDGRIGYGFAPRFILSCTEGLFREAAVRARALGAIIHTHAAEHGDERAAVKALLGDDDVAILTRWGVSGPNAILAHGVQLRDDEVRELAALGTRVSHCPSANLKLGSGIARVAELRKGGLLVGLGADGAPCNNNMDPFVEMRHAALLAKVTSGTTSLPAREVLRMATIDGARALGLGAVTGSLEVGKEADVVMVSLEGLHLQPARDLASTLVYAAQARDVRHVFVAGRQVVADGVLSTLEAPRVAAEARRHAEKTALRAGLA